MHNVMDGFAVTRLLSLRTAEEENATIVDFPICCHDWGVSEQLWKLSALSQVMFTLTKMSGLT